MEIRRQSRNTVRGRDSDKIRTRIWQMRRRKIVILAEKIKLLALRLFQTRLLPQLKIIAESFSGVLGTRLAKAMLLLMSVFLLTGFRFVLYSPGVVKFATRFEAARCINDVLTASGIVNSSDAEVIEFLDLTGRRARAVSSTTGMYLMEGFSDGSFRPDSPISSFELLHTWAKLMRLVTPKVQTGRKDSHRDPAETCNLERDVLFLIETGVMPDSFSLAASHDASGDNCFSRELSTGSDRIPTSILTEIHVRTLEKLPELNAKATFVSSELPRFRLKGIAKDAVSQKPLSQARLTANGTTVPVSDTGEFSVANLEENSILEIFAAASGYRSFTARYRITQDNDIVVLLRPQPAAIEISTVCSATRKPVSGALVSISGRTDRTNAAGKVSFKGLGAGYYMMSVTAEGYQTTDSLVALNDLKSRRTISLDPEWSNHSTL